MILGWKTDMTGLMLAFQFTMPFSITEGQNFPHFPYNLAQQLSSITKGHHALSPYIVEHQTRHHKHAGPANR
jgi:hypothetical protein